MHQNMKLMIRGCNLPSLTKNLQYHLIQYEDCLNLMTCNDSGPQCFRGVCKECPGEELLHEVILKILYDNDIENITYSQWISKPRTSLEIFTKCTEEFVNEFCFEAKQLLQHSFIAKEQAKFMRTLKNSLKVGEYLVMCDFAENYAFVVQSAAPGFHWNNNQATIYPVIVYYNTGLTIEHKSMVIISNCLHHDSVAVYVFSRVINNFVATIADNPLRIYYCSDGAPQQFKNYKNFVNIYHHEEDFGVAAEWHFFATAHGKGPCDDIGGTIKRLAARSSLQLPPEQQITTPQDLYNKAKKPDNIPGIEVKYTDEYDYEAAKNLLHDRFEQAKPVPKTQKLHCLIPTSSGSVITKRYSADRNFEICPIMKKKRKFQMKANR